MSTITLAQSATDQTYDDLKRMVWQLCLRHVNRFGGELDEAVSVANLAYAEAYQKFDPGRGTKFITLLHHHVRYRLRKAWEKEWRDSGRVAADTEGIAEAPAPNGGGDLGLFLESLSDDAADVVRLTVDSFGDLGHVFRPAGGLEARRALRDRFRSLGWTAWQVAASFAEIRLALAGVKEG